MCPLFILWMLMHLASLSAVVRTVQQRYGKVTFIFSFLLLYCFFHDLMIHVCTVFVRFFMPVQFGHNLLRPEDWMAFPSISHKTTACICYVKCEYYSMDFACLSFVIFCFWLSAMTTDPRHGYFISSVFSPT